VTKVAGLAAALALCCAAQPSAALANVITVEGQAGAFGNTIKQAGPFEDVITFTVPARGADRDGRTAVEVSLISDVHLSSVTLNGVELADSLSGENEFRSIAPLPTPAGPQVLQVRGESGGDGSYSGTLAIKPAPVPEPAGWTTMLLALGLLGIGLKLSRRRARPAEPTER
jgi:hypothetical protein